MCVCMCVHSLLLVKHVDIRDGSANTKSHGIRGDYFSPLKAKSDVNSLNITTVLESLSGDNI